MSLRQVCNFLPRTLPRLVPRAVPVAQYSLAQPAVWRSVAYPSRNFSTSLWAPQEPQTQTAEPTKPQEVPDLTPIKLNSAAGIYAVIRIHGQPYLVTKGDTVHLPFRVKDVEVGDVMNFTNVTTVGSRDFTYNCKTGIDPSLVTVKACVLEKTMRPMTVKKVTKRRNRRVRTVRSKHFSTIIRINELSIN